MKEIIELKNIFKILKRRLGEFASFLFLASVTIYIFNNQTILVRFLSLLLSIAYILLSWFLLKYYVRIQKLFIVIKFPRQAYSSATIVLLIISFIFSIKTITSSKISILMFNSILYFSILLFTFILPNYYSKLIDSIISKQSLDKPTKQAHLLHASILQQRDQIVKDASQSISKNYNVPLKEATEKCAIYVTGLMIHIVHILILEEIENGGKVAKSFLEDIGKSDNDINEIHKFYGELKTETERKFKTVLYEYLNVPIEDTLSKLYYLRIKSASAAIVEVVNKEGDNIELIDGVLNIK